MPNKAFRLALKELDDDTGVFTGLASVYGVQDLGGDVVMPGAFAKTLSTGGPTRPLLWQHRDPVGTATLVDTGSALAVKGKLSLGLQSARDALTLLKDQVVQGLSIGFQSVQESYDSDGVRCLSEIKLWEISLVTFPMNELATVTGVKAQQHQTAAVSRALREFKSDILSALER